MVPFVRFFLVFVWMDFCLPGVLSCFGGVFMFLLFARGFFVGLVF